MGATIPARIQPDSIDHVPFPTVVPCLGASLALREAGEKRLSLLHQKDVASEEEAESRRRDSKDQVQGTSGTPHRLGTALVFLGIKIFVTLQNFTFHRGSARYIIRIRRFRFQTDGETSFVRKAFYRGLKVVSSAFRDNLFHWFLTLEYRALSFRILLSPPNRRRL
ncbi:hypothetical protein ACOSP7_023671 [Xanthoceras sorbifolium]